MEEDPLSEEKLNLLQEIGMLLDYFEIERNGDIPFDLLLSVKVLFMDKDEFNIYKNEMINAGFVMEENDEEDDEDEETSETTSDKKSTGETKKEGKEEEKPMNIDDNEEMEEDGEGEEDDEEAQVLPEIKNEESVFKALISIADEKLKMRENIDSSVIDWSKPGMIRKPSLVSVYLKEIEKDILQKFISNCKNELSKDKQQSAKRKYPGGNEPPSKKKKSQ